jgi:replication-associated recombination protein RarA
VTAQEHLPEELRGRRFYQPGTLGYEKRIAERLEWFRSQTGQG